jgi:hypothetical protein
MRSRWASSEIRASHNVADPRCGVSQVMRGLPNNLFRIWLPLLADRGTLFAGKRRVWHSKTSGKGWLRAVDPEKYGRNFSGHYVLRVLRLVFTNP